LNSNEHDKTADTAVFTKKSGASYKAPAFQFTLTGTSTYPDGIVLTSTHTFTYGQLIALAGDYFGNPQSLMYGDANDLNDIVTSDTYQKDHVSWGFVDNQPSYLTLLSYLSLATKNPEHFRGSPQIINGKYGFPADANYDDSVVVYSKGHGAAINYAMNAKNDTELLRAYVINAFYDHFMTDMFSSGHMRVPRRILHYPRVGDFFTVRQMHDEDSKEGLWVTDGNEIWQAYGDKHQLLANDDGTLQLKSGKYQVNPVNQRNWDKCQEAVKISVDEITSLNSTDSTKFKVLQSRPEVFPPGSDVYPNSKINDYTLAMKMSSTANSPTPPWIPGFIVTSKNFPGLLIPEYLRRIVASNDQLPPLLWKYWGNYSYVNPMPTQKKIVYELNNTYTGDTSGGKLGTQTYPIYIVAEGVLFVRITDDPRLNQYVTAEFDPNNVTAYDTGITPTSPPAPQIKSRLVGPQQGNNFPTYP
jgi:hypothetical protein